MEKLLTTEQVAKIFDVSESTVTKNFIQKGLKYIEIGSRDYRYELKDVIEFIETIKKQKVEQIDEFKIARIRSKKMKIV